MSGRVVMCMYYTSSFDVCRSYQVCLALNMSIVRVLIDKQYQTFWEGFVKFFILECWISKLVKFKIYISINTSLSWDIYPYVPNGFYDYDVTICCICACKYYICWCICICFVMCRFSNVITNQASTRDRRTAKVGECCTKIETRLTLTHAWVGVVL